MDVRAYLSAIGRHKWTVFASIAVTVGLAVALTLTITPQYAASSRVLVQPRASDLLFDGVAPAIAQSVQSIDTERQIIQSQAVAQRTAEILGVERNSLPAVRTTTVGSTTVIDIVVTGPDPEGVAAAANAYAEAYVDFRRDQLVNDLTGAGQQLREKVDELQQDIDSVERSIAAGDDEPTVAQEGRLRSLTTQQETFQGLLDQIELSSALRSGGAQVVQQAEVPTEPVAPKPARNVLFALVFGGVIGIVLALLREQFDDRVRDLSDLESVSGDLPVIGTIPNDSASGSRSVVVVSDPRSVTAEAYRSLRTAVQFLGLNRQLRRLVITSPLPGDGKTTIAVNLAAAAAAAGFRVVLIDCDLRASRLPQLFTLDTTRGLTSTLVGSNDAQSSLQAIAGAPTLKVVPAGPPPPNPAEVLASALMSQFLDRVSADADLVILDAPPLLPVTDALAVSPFVDGLLLVAREGRSHRRDVRRALNLAQQIEAPILGLILNDSRGRGSNTYYTEYTERSSKTRARR